MTRVIISTAFFAALLSICNIVSAEVRLPNGEWQEQKADMSVESLGGAVLVSHSWQAKNLNAGDWQWFINPAWANLELQFATDERGIATLHTIRKAGVEYMRGGDGLFLYGEDFRITETEGGWRWEDRRGDWVRYSSSGVAMSFGSLIRETGRFVRDALGRIAVVNDRRDTKLLEFHYGGHGRVERVEDYSGREVSYQWAEVGAHVRIVKVIGVNGGQWTYGYDQTGEKMIKRIDPENGELTIEYTGNRVSSVINEDGKKTKYSYEFNKVSRIYEATVTSAEGVKKQYIYDRRGRLQVFSIDGAIHHRVSRDGEVAEHHTNERGIRTTIEYDANRNPIKIRLAGGAEYVAKFDSIFRSPTEVVDEAGVRTKYEYRSDGQIAAKIEAPETAVERKTEYAYYSSDDPAVGAYEGHLASTTLSGAGSALSVSHYWKYDARGNVIEERNAVGGVTRYGDFNVTGNYSSMRDALQKDWKHEYNESGLVLSTTTPLGRKSWFIYDKMGRKVEEFSPLAGVTKYTYSKAGLLLKKESESGAAMSFTYNDDGQIESIRHDSSNPAFYFYDSQGRVSRISTPDQEDILIVYGDGSAAGLVVKRIFSRRTEEYSYDVQGRVISTATRLESDGADDAPITSTRTYDGAGVLVSESNPGTGVVEYRYDMLGRLVEEVSAARGKKTYRYSLVGGVSSVTDEGGKRHQTEYDLAGRKIHDIAPSGGKTIYKYDSLGQLIEKTLPSGVRAEYVHSDDREIIAERYYRSGATVPEETILFNFSADGLLAGYSQVGGATVAASYNYDAMGRLTSEEVRYEGIVNDIFASIGISYGEGGKVESIEYPDSSLLTYTYGQNGRMTAASSPAGDVVFSDFQEGLPTKITYPGSTKSIGRDDLSRMTGYRLTAPIVGGSAEDDVLDFSYSYGRSGLLASRESSGLRLDYGYDPSGRLVSVSPSGQPVEDLGAFVESYTYDSSGNRLSSHTVEGGWSYGAGNELLRYGHDADGASFEYDADGNLKSKIIKSNGIPSVENYLYDARSRLVSIERDGLAVAKYAYDPYGRRIMKNSGGENTWFVYSPFGLAAEIGAQGNTQVRYAWEPSTIWSESPLWMAKIEGAETRTAYFHNDIVSKPDALVDESAVLVWKQAADSFGLKIGSKEGAWDTYVSFPGQYFDPESGYAQNYFRDYDATTGRYIQSDPIGYLGGANYYAYAESSPTNLIDPEGLRGGLRLGDKEGKCTVVCGADGLAPYLDCGTKERRKWCGIETCLILHENVHIAHMRQMGGEAYCKFVYDRRRPGLRGVAFRSQADDSRSEFYAYLESIICVSGLQEKYDKNCDPCWWELERVKQLWYDEMEAHSHNF